LNGTAGLGCMTNLKNRRKSHFAEISADIVLKEREQKKYGNRYNLGQSIASALERAYKLGREQCDMPDDQQMVPSYIDVPRRFRSLIETLVIYSEFPKSGVVLYSNGKAKITDDVYGDEIDSDFRFKESTIVALVKLGMLVKYEEVEFHAFRLSDIAKRLYDEYKYNL